MTTNTPTPRTDAIVAELRLKPRACSIHLADISRTLELELAAKDALLREVEPRISNILAGVPMRDLDEYIVHVRRALGEKP